MSWPLKKSWKLRWRRARRSRTTEFSRWEGWDLTGLDFPFGMAQLALETILSAGKAPEQTSMLWRNESRKEDRKRGMLPAARLLVLP